MPRWLQTLLEALGYVIEKVVPDLSGNKKRPKPGPDVPRFEEKDK